VLAPKSEAERVGIGTRVCMVFTDVAPGRRRHVVAIPGVGSAARFVDAKALLIRSWI